MKQVIIPKLGQTMESATLINWLVADGEQVEEGQGILEVETDKAVFTVEANSRGHVHLGPFKAGDVVDVLAIVATIGTSADRFVAEKHKTTIEPGRLSVREPSSQPATASTPKSGQIFASPRARKLAQMEKVDLSNITATGYGGERIVERDVIALLDHSVKATPVAQLMAHEAGIDIRTLGVTPGRLITKADVEQAIARAKSGSTSPDGIVSGRVPLAGIRGIIAERMAASAHTTARVTLLMEVDATELVAARVRLKRFESEWGFAAGYNDLLAKIVAKALRQYPYMNARLASGSIERLGNINLGMATDTERGLVVPVVHDVDKKSLRQFGVEFRELVARARTSKSTLDDFSGGTFTITNLGMYDVLAFTPVINLPETAILGVGSISSRPVARDGQIVVREILMLSLAFDHRVVDGAPAARFLQSIKGMIDQPIAESEF